MVKTRSQSMRTETIDTTRMDGYSDDESECRVPEFLTRDQLDEVNNGDWIDRRVDIEQSSVD